MILYVIRHYSLFTGEDLNEWVAVNTVDFFNQINMLYGTITDFCTEDNCPIMSAGPKYEYHWADGRSVKKPIKCSAPKYIDFLMTWVQDQLDDESLFPSKIGVPFPKDFMLIGKLISYVTHFIRALEKYSLVIIYFYILQQRPY